MAWGLGSSTAEIMLSFQEVFRNNDFKYTFKKKEGDVWPMLPPKAMQTQDLG